MSIWVHSQHSREPERFNYLENRCAFCKEPLLQIGSILEASISVCNLCGWWRAHRSDFYVYHKHHHETITTHYGAAASLQELDLSDLSTPVNEVRDYLTARFESRETLNPRLLEQTVGSIFSDLGWVVAVTSYGNDGGIDIFLEKNRELVGVQVKRYRNAIKVEQIRSLAGALVLEGLTKGIFVTTSSFQRSAELSVRRYETKGYKIELMDAPRLFDALRLAQREKYKSVREVEIPSRLLKNLPQVAMNVHDPYWDMG